MNGMVFKQFSLGKGIEVREWDIIFLETDRLV